MHISISGLHLLSTYRVVGIVMSALHYRLIKSSQQPYGNTIIGLFQMKKLSLDK